MLPCQCVCRNEFEEAEPAQPHSTTCSTGLKRNTFDLLIIDDGENVR